MTSQDRVNGGRPGDVAERAKRIHRIGRVREDWEDGFVWRNHTTASHEFQLLDVLRDIRLVLTLILVALLLGQCHARPEMTIHLDRANTAQRAA